MGVFLKGMRYVFTDFSCWTSTHGVPHIGMANARWLRLFWIVVVVACLAAFLWQFATLLQSYLSFSVNTETTNGIFRNEVEGRVQNNWTHLHLIAAAIRRADVSQRHDLPSQRVEIQPNPIGRPANQRSREGKNVEVQAYQTEGASPMFGWGARVDDERQKRATQWALLYSERLEEIVEQGTDIAYSYDDMVISCTYNAKNCNQTDFDEVYNPTYGICQQFNFNGEYSSSRAGPLYGLRMVLRTDQANYLPWTETSGVIMVIHTQDEIAYPDVFGYFAPPGTASSLGVNYVSTTRLSSPYGTCTNQSTLETTHYSGSYTVEACFRSCMQEKIVADCGCYDPAYSHAYNTSSVVSCDGFGDPSKNLACIDNINNPDTSVFNIMTECNCPQPCNIDTYGVTVSTAQWPSLSYTPSECFPNANSSKPWLSTGDSCISWYKKNTLLIEIYYERMNFQVLTESPAYTLVNFISDVGGQVGLFLGMSIISVIEFLTLFMLLFCYCATHKRRKMEIEQMENDVANAQKKADDVAAKARLHQQQKSALYGDAGDPMPPPPTDAV